MCEPSKKTTLCCLSSKPHLNYSGSLNTLKQDIEMADFLICYNNNSNNNIGYRTYIKIPANKQPTG